MTHNAIVLGSHTTALHVVRSLGRNGFKVAVIADNLRGEARFSKYCGSFVKIARFEADETVAAIEHVAGEFGGCAIFPTNDEAVKALSQSISSLEPEHVPIVAPWSTTAKAYDKKATYELARSCEIPVPRTYYVNEISDIGDISRQCEYPALIKPTTTASFRSKFHAKAIGVQDENDLLSRFAQISETFDPYQLMVQEFIPGTNRHFWHYGAVFDCSRPIVEYVISRKRQYPADFGTATHAEIVQKPEVAELGSRILAAMKFSGPAEVQFKYDQRTGTYWLLDVNPRFWKSFAIADLLNVNMPLLAYQVFNGSDVSPAPVSIEERLIWYDMLPDVLVSMADVWKRRSTIKEWLNSYSGKRIEATFARDDWLPGILLVAMAPYIFFKGVS